MEKGSKVGLLEEAALKEKSYIRLGRAAFVLRYEQWQRHEAARTTQHISDREPQSKDEDGSPDQWR